MVARYRGPVKWNGSTTLFRIPEMLVRSSLSYFTKPIPNRIRTTSEGLRTGSWLMPSRRYTNLLQPNEIRLKLGLSIF